MGTVPVPFLLIVHFIFLRIMTNFDVTIIDEHDCTVAGRFQLTAVDRADAEIQLLEEFGTGIDYLQIDETVWVEDI